MTVTYETAPSTAVAEARRGADPILTALAKRLGGRRLHYATGGPFKGWETWEFPRGNVEDFLDQASGGNEKDPVWSGWDGEGDITMIPPTTELAEQEPTGVGPSPEQRRAETLQKTAEVLRKQAAEIKQREAEKQKQDAARKQAAAKKTEGRVRVVALGESVYEWERGTIKIPPKEWARFKKSIIDAANWEQSQHLDAALKLYKRFKDRKAQQQLKDQIRGWKKRNPKSKLKMRDVTPYNVFAAVTSGFGAPWDLDSAMGYLKGHYYELPSGVDAHVVEELLFKSDAAGKHKLRKPAANHPSVKKLPATAKRVSVGWEGSISFDNTAKTVTWDVPENNKSVRSANDHPVGRAFHAALRRIKWTPGTGGRLVGNDEYNRGAGQEYEGGGGNYVTSRYGPRGEPDWEKKQAKRQRAADRRKRKEAQTQKFPKGARVKVGERHGTVLEWDATHRPAYRGSGFVPSRYVYAPPRRRTSYGDPFPHYRIEFDDGKTEWVNGMQVAKGKPKPSAKKAPVSKPPAKPVPKVEPAKPPAKPGAVKKRGGKLIAAPKGMRYAILDAGKRVPRGTKRLGFAVVLQGPKSKTLTRFKGNVRKGPLRVSLVTLVNELKDASVISMKPTASKWVTRLKAGTEVYVGSADGPLFNPKEWRSIALYQVVQIEDRLSPDWELKLTEGILELTMPFTYEDLTEARGFTTDIRDMIVRGLGLPISRRKHLGALYQGKYPVTYGRGETRGSFSIRFGDMTPGAGRQLLKAVRDILRPRVRLGQPVTITKDWRGAKPGKVHIWYTQGKRSFTLFIDPPG